MPAFFVYATKEKDLKPRSAEQVRGSSDWGRAVRPSPFRRKNFLNFFLKSQIKNNFFAVIEGKYYFKGA